MLWLRNYIYIFNYLFFGGGSGGGWGWIGTLSKRHTVKLEFKFTKFAAVEHLLCKRIIHWRSAHYAVYTRA